jgi:phosphoadenosine phosphosulfate reductase
MTPLDAIIGRHDRIALQFSGGRDSLAVLHLMQPYWDRLTVYWCNTGDAYPETRELMAQVRAMVPHFVEIAGDQPGVVAQFGIPSDVVPATHAEMGRSMAGGANTLIQDRYHCCARTMMLPTHARMVADGITLIIRGQRADDAIKATTRSGQIVDGFELLFPIEDWDAARVDAFLSACKVDMPPFYATMSSMPDCMTCSAFWETGQGAYRAAHQPQAHAVVLGRMDAINDAMRTHIINFNREINHAF